MRCLVKDMKILTPVQNTLLVAVGKSALAHHVYFTGGTLLASRYLQHRRSFDLDFFSDDLLDDFFVAASTKEIFEAAAVSKVRYVRFPSRWEFFLTIGREEIKFDIAYFPFPAIGRHIRLPDYGLQGDSLRDIAVNKVHACFERDAPRDAFDLFVIMKRKGWTMESLLKDVERKFGTTIDLVYLTAKLIQSVQRLEEVRPLFVGVHPTPEDMIGFFQKSAYTFLRRRLRA